MRHGPFSATLAVYWAVLRKPRNACPAAVYPQLCHKPVNRSRGQPATIGRRFFPQPPRTGPLAKKPAMPGSPRRFARATIHRQLFHSFPAPRSTAIVGNSPASDGPRQVLENQGMQEKSGQKTYSRAQATPGLARRYSFTLYPQQGQQIPGAESSPPDKPRALWPGPAAMRPPAACAQPGHRLRTGFSTDSVDNSGGGAHHLANVLRQGLDALTRKHHRCASSSGKDLSEAHSTV